MCYEDTLLSINHLLAWIHRMIVAVLGEKGGTGKTTLATNLAGMRAAAGRQVLLVDADRQGSASYWAEQRRTTAHPAVTCLQKFGRALARDLRALAPRYEDVIVDVAAGDSPDLEDVLRMAERVLIPVQPAGLDVWTLGLLDDRVAEAQAVNPSLTAFVVLNRASPNPRDRDTHDAQQAMACLCPPPGRPGGHPGAGGHQARGPCRAERPGIYAARSQSHRRAGAGVPARL